MINTIRCDCLFALTMSDSGSRPTRRAKNIAISNLHGLSNISDDIDLDDSSDVSDDDNVLDTPESEIDTDDHASESDEEDSQDETQQSLGDFGGWCFEDIIPDATEIDDLCHSAFNLDSATITADDFDHLSSDPLDYANLFLTEDLLSSICDWTNKRAQQHLQTLRDRNQTEAANTFCNKWTDVNIVELRGFLAQVFLMGIIRKPDMRSYWTTEYLTCTPIFVDSSTLSRDRFLMILKFLRFSDPQIYSPENKYSRVSQLFDKINLINKTSYLPRRKLNIDESLMLWKGRLRFRVFIRTKRARYGLKLLILSDCDGYMIAVILYVGNEDNMLTEDETANELTRSSKIVVHLLRKAELLDKRYVVYIDNWFNSLSLATWLKNRNTLICGTIRADRGIPQQLRSKPLQKGTYAFARKDDILAIKFNDRKEMYFLSNFHSASRVEKQRRLRGGGTQTYSKPGPIDDYNFHMNGTDKQDQQLKPYQCIRKSYKWFVKIGLHLLQRMMLNGYKVYCNSLPRPLPSSVKVLSFQAFLKSYINAYVHCRGSPAPEGESVRRPKKRIRSVDPPTVDLPLREQHDLHRIPPTPKKAKPTRQCRNCLQYEDKRRRESSYYCPKCPGSPALCVGDCAINWHRNL